MWVTLKTCLSNFIEKSPVLLKTKKNKPVINTTELKLNLCFSNSDDGDILQSFSKQESAAPRMLGLSDNIRHRHKQTVTECLSARLFNEDEETEMKREADDLSPTKVQCLLFYTKRVLQRSKILTVFTRFFNFLQQAPDLWRSDLQSFSSSSCSRLHCLWEILKFLSLHIFLRSCCGEVPKHHVQTVKTPWRRLVRWVHVSVAYWQDRVGPGVVVDDCTDGGASGRGGWVELTLIFTLLLQNLLKHSLR